jgi:hypothetical protein
VKHAILISAILFTVHAAHCGELYERVLPAGSTQTKALRIPLRLAEESRDTVRELISFRDPGWDALTAAQVAASLADARTSLTVFERKPNFGEVGVSRYVVGVHPDAHKYILAGAIEIGVEAIAAHYLRNHGPVRKWYWRSLWMLPQSLSLYGHAEAAIANLKEY